MRRLTRGRAATDDEATPQASAASEPVSATPDAQQGGSGLPANGTAPAAADEPKTAVLGDATKGGDAKTGETKVDATAVDAQAPSDLPAGVDPGRLAAVPSSARRGQLRRRLRYLRAVREILLRDIGGFYYEAQRAEDGVEPHRALLDAKAGRLARLDEEVRDLESRLDEPRPTTILREPGLGGTCPQCGELHASDARYCSRCGTALSSRAARSRTAAGPSGPLPAVSASSDDGKATTASLWGRPKRLDPATQSGPDEATQAAAPEGSEEPAATIGDEKPAATSEGEKPAATSASHEPVANEPAATSETDKPAAERA